MHMRIKAKDLRRIIKEELDSIDKRAQAATATIDPEWEELDGFENDDVVHFNPALADAEERERIRKGWDYDDTLLDDEAIDDPLGMEPGAQQVDAAGTPRIAQSIVDLDAAAAERMDGIDMYDEDYDETLDFGDDGSLSHGASFNTAATPRSAKNIADLDAAYRKRTANVKL